LSEQVIGIILRGRKEKIEQIISDIERERAVKILYVRRPKYPDPFMLIIELRKQKE